MNVHNNETAVRSVNVHNNETECPLLFKGSDFGGSAGQGFTTARLAIPGTVCTLPTFTQPMEDTKDCLLPGSKATHKTHKGLSVAWK